MIAILKNLLFGDAEHQMNAGQHSDSTLHHAVAGLMIEAAMVDGNFDNTERQRIEKLLEIQFDLSANDIKTLITSAEIAAKTRVELHTITRVVCDSFSPDERVRMVEKLWEIVAADGNLDDFEANIMRRVAGLLYVSDRESGEARKRALKDFAK